MDKMHNYSISKTLDELANEEIMRQIPLMIYLIILCIFGIVGNTLVCYIYTKKYTLSTFRTFVTVLAAVDLFISAVVIPFELLQFNWQYTYKCVVVCKLTLFVKTWATITSGSLLFCIAIDRYRKVCKPFCWQISLTAARNLCFGSALVGVAVAWISPVIYNIRTKELDAYNVTISECAITASMKKTIFPLIHMVAPTVLFVGALTGIIIMYILIAIRIKQRMKKKIEVPVERKQDIKNDPYVTNTNSAKHIVSDDYKSGNASVINVQELPNRDFSGHKDRGRMAKIGKKIERGSTDCVKTYSVDVSEDDMINTISASGVNAAKTINGTFGVYGNREQGEGIETDSQDPEKDVKESDHVSIDEITTTGNSTATPDKVNLETVEKKPRENCKAEKSLPKRCLNVGGNKMKSYKTTLIMSIVSLTFVVSYLPLLSILLIVYADKTFVASLTDSGRSAYKFIHRSYFLNCAVNPIIYGIWDARFRQSCKKMLTCRKKV